jgi:hypothetical protein
MFQPRKLSALLVDRETRTFIVWTTQKIGEAFERILRWVQRVRMARVEEPFTRAAAEMAKFPFAIIEKLQRFPGESLSSLDQAIREPSSGDPGVLEFHLSFDVHNLDVYNEAWEDATRRYDAGDY